MRSKLSTHPYQLSSADYSPSSKCKRILDIPKNKRSVSIGTAGTWTVQETAIKASKGSQACQVQRDTEHHSMGPHLAFCIPGGDLVPHVLWHKLCVTVV